MYIIIQYIHVRTCIFILNFMFSKKGVAPYLISPLEGIQGLGVSVTWAFGCDVACADSSGFGEAVEVAKAAEAVVMVVGLDQGQERYVRA